ncbi:MAG: hypothetical protein Q7S02_05955 [bacterium]|nr:hypothetical protein [bacterium]
MTPNGGQVYLLMDDLYHLFAGWARKHGFMLPPREFFQHLVVDLKEAVAQAVGIPSNDVHVIGSEVLADQVRSLVEEYAADVPIVCVDRMLAAAMPSERWLPYESTRLVEHRDGAWQKVGDGPRPKCPPLDEQVARIVQQLGAGREIAIVDDGCYTSGSLLRCAGRFTEAGLRVRCAIVGIRREAEHGQKFPFPVHRILFYPPDRLLDWVDLRDFILGCSEGGRVVTGGGNGHANAPGTPEYAVPYLDGFGDLMDCASIPPRSAVAFTERCLHLAADLYAAIGANSRRPVLMRHIGRWPYDSTGHPLRCDVDRPIADVIADLRASIRIPRVDRADARA